jgi:outer membrane receptor protein involved in Fe transport
MASQLTRSYSTLESAAAGARAIRVALLAGLAALGVSTIGVAGPAAENAEPANAPATPAESTEMDQVVVTATATGVRKLDASYTIVTANQEAIKDANAKSTADLLKISPGIWAESTGGQTGANIEVAGFPTGGDAPYFTLQLNGAPVYGSPTLSFFEQSSMFRLDDTVERVEIVQGGPAVLFADGQPGSSANFILRRGSDKTEGSFALTYGSENLERIDTFYSGKISDGWYGSAGGFYRYSKGVRNPQFPADQGGQFTVTLAHDLDNGTAMVYARYLNDRNQFITPIPLTQRGSDQFSAYPGFDPLTSTYNSDALRHVFLPTYPGGGSNADLGDGRGAQVWFAGGNLDLQFDGGWSVSDRLILTGGNMDTNALFSGTNPASLTDELSNLPTSQGGYQLPVGAVVSASYVGGGAVDPNQSVIHQGWWFIHKHMFNINNDLRINKKLFEGNTLTLGFYVAHFTSDDKWSLGNQMLMSNTPNARPIVVTYTLGGTSYYRTDPQGFIDFSGNFDITENGTATNKALYLSDSWRLDKWLFDAGVRADIIDMSNKVCNLSNVDLDGNPNTLYDNSTPVCNGTYNTIDYNPTRTSFTAGVNYEFTSSMSAYLRFNKGFHFNDFDNGIRSGNATGKTPPEQTIENYEVGYKFQNQYVYADLSAYYKIFSGLQYTPTNGLGSPIPGATPLVYGADSRGLNASVAVTPIAHLKLQLVGNYLDGKYTHFTNSCFPFTNLVTGQQSCQPIEGQQLQRQPKWRMAFTPSYVIPFGWGDVNTFITFTHVGPHTQDQAGLQQLGTYNTLDIGVVASYGDHWQLRLQGTNLTNELGLTESNSRVFGSAVGAGGVILARPLEGHEVNVQLRYTL